MKTQDEKIAELISDPAQFSDWWRNRDEMRFRVPDRAIIAAAEAAGLVVRGGQFLWLTSAGRRLRRTQHVSSQVSRQSDAADLARRLRKRRGA